jgi:hypothetical protein
MPKMLIYSWCMRRQVFVCDDVISIRDVILTGKLLSPTDYFQTEYKKRIQPDINNTSITKESQKNVASVYNMDNIGKCKWRNYFSDLRLITPIDCLTFPPIGRTFSAFKMADRYCLERGFSRHKISHEKAPLGTRLALFSDGRRDYIYSPAHFSLPNQVL